MRALGPGLANQHIETFVCSHYSHHVTKLAAPAAVDGTLALGNRDKSIGVGCTISCCHARDRSPSAVTYEAYRRKKKAVLYIFQ